MNSPDSSSAATAEPVVDVVLIGAGIMSATLGMMLKELQPDLTITVLERLDVAAAESSDAWNNAGTGHSAFCELNYTPERADGSIDISKAISIAEQFEQSKQFWAFLAEKYAVKELSRFVNHIDHMSFVWGERNVEYLRKRHAALVQSPLFKEMVYSEDPAQLQQWIPLVMEGRDPAQRVAATCMALGTDVNFGSLTRGMFTLLQQKPGVTFHFNHEVDKLRQKEDGLWRVKATDRHTGETRKVRARFVFIGAGGGSLPLLEKSGIPEGRGFGGFPVSGQWLKCVNPAVIARHDAKVYGKAAVGSPPMSVPHLDTRMINGKRELLFGPYAGFSTKFLKKGSFLDLPLSIQLSNLRPMIIAGLKNIPLTRYLINQVRQSPEDRLAALREYLPEARAEDWQLEIAGQRVQVIKKHEKEGGVLEFGTEVVSAADGSIAALLGASPGASTAVSIMVGLVQRCFPEQTATPAWQAMFKEMIPSYGLKLNDNPQLLDEIRAHTHAVLGLNTPESVARK
ncbi:malate:quinone oxidoreductase [Hymenobacter busanensis]|uniref:Probable malate:quinone oxidoreductase n=1 Tax=Hymenobacter busanensis TaxID=2607656 RepID=A0A7L4ZUP1_9BACT|nr:malate:quinone oxidoreductase [Hymenobacter busanensis]KAA9339327.1 malate:quinone oxidoreductase [Hymenobacter busanensis]QHJ06911.1 malate:quinone oxidoreductase [Hymenobacter busanensis]